MPKSEGTAMGNYKPKKPKKKKSNVFGTAFHAANTYKPHKKGSFSNFYGDALTHKDKSGYNQSMYGSGKKKKGKHSNIGAGSSGSSSGGSTGYSSGSSRGGSSGGGGGRKKKKGKGGAGNARLKARSLVTADTNSQILALLNQARGQRMNKNYGISQAGAAYTRQKGDLDYLFNEAKDFNAAQSAKIDTQYGATKNDVASLYANFAGEQQTQVNSRKAAAMAELQRLGIGDSGLQNFDSDAQASQSAGALAQTNAQSNLDAMKVGSDAIGNLLQGMATGSHNQFLGNAMNTKNDAVSQANQNFAVYMQGILGKANELKSQEFVKTNDLSQQLSQLGGAFGRSKKAKRRLLKSYAAQNKRGNNLDKLLGALR